MPLGMGIPAPPVATQIGEQDLEAIRELWGEAAVDAAIAAARQDHMVLDPSLPRAEQAPGDPVVLGKGKRGNSYVGMGLMGVGQARGEGVPPQPYHTNPFAISSSSSGIPFSEDALRRQLGLEPRPGAAAEPRDPRPAAATGAPAGAEAGGGLVACGCAGRAHRPRPGARRRG